MNYLEIIGTLLGVAYLYWEYKASAWLWVAGIAMPAIYLGVYYEAGLYADFGISIYYIIASVYGLVCWLSNKGKTDKGEEGAKGITHTPRKAYPTLVAGFFVVFAIIGYVLSKWTDSTVPLADAFTTALSIVAMWMLAKKYLEQWLVWIMADVGCSILYAYKGLWLTGGLYLAYSVVAVLGYIRWRYLIQSNPGEKKKT